MKKTVLTAQALLTQTEEQSVKLQQERNLEDSLVALERAIQDKESELKNHTLEEDSRVKNFVDSQNANDLLDKGKKAAIEEDLACLERIYKERYPKK